MSHQLFIMLRISKEVAWIARHTLCPTLFDFKLKFRSKSTLGAHLLEDDLSNISCFFKLFTSHGECLQTFSAQTEVQRKVGIDVVLATANGRTERVC